MNVTLTSAPVVWVVSTSSDVVPVMFVTPGEVVSVMLTSVAVSVLLLSGVVFVMLA